MSFTSSSLSGVKYISYVQLLLKGWGFTVVERYNEVTKRRLHCFGTWKRTLQLKHLLFQTAALCCVCGFFSRNPPTKKTSLWLLTSAVTTSLFFFFFVPATGGTGAVESDDTSVPEQWHLRPDLHEEDVWRQRRLLMLGGWSGAAFRCTAFDPRSYFAIFVFVFLFPSYIFIYK